MTDKEEFDSFLTKVDQVSALIEALRSPDSATVEQASRQADLITRGRLAEGAVDEGAGSVVTAENRNCVNPRPAVDPATAQQEDFKRQMEADAAERAEKKKKAKMLSDTWKEKAIASFRAGKYDDALEKYTNAITELKDSCLLYTSRAQTLLKLKRAREAMQDLDLALRLDETSLRAWIHKGKAHIQLGQHADAVESFQQAIKLHPDQRKVIQVYIDDLERSRVRNAFQPLE
ncbi:tetratricopeptide repeat protein 12-like [Amphibalanus amphitrite]|uniref:tetratricopeptide repeat protein 12-like n=1 Tax=Amphibalanus amphitrite TaxID=1232801 RepID=UPI001C8FE3AF|nr:tetratricopeptide repeat protein 12-like [Amphibalanus amphitrite]